MYSGLYFLTCKLHTILNRLLPFRFPSLLLLTPLRLVLLTFRANPAPFSSLRNYHGRGVPRRG